MPMAQALHDRFRVEFLSNYTTQVMAARHIDGVNVMGCRPPARHEYTGLQP
jgi:hypothetical protein